MDIENNIISFQTEAAAKGCRLVAVSKNQSIEKITKANAAGQRLFGENKVQEMVGKYEVLPKDIAWHMIGHLQSNKVKQIVRFVSLIHSIDSMKLLEEVDKQGKKNNRVVPCLLQVHIASEETKFGFDPPELLQALESAAFQSLNSVSIQGLMGMASLTEDHEKIRGEFRGLKNLFEELHKKNIPGKLEMRELSMGMSSDYKIALDEGSTLIRIGSSLFGQRE
jgi:pyridoxal phosphate enzyme (YggS family)